MFSRKLALELSHVVEHEMSALYGMTPGKVNYMAHSSW